MSQAAQEKLVKAVLAAVGSPTSKSPTMPVSAKLYQAPLRPPTLQIDVSQVKKLSTTVATAPPHVSGAPPPAPALALAVELAAVEAVELTAVELAVVDAPSVVELAPVEDTASPVELATVVVPPPPALLEVG